jgi:regulatory protein
MESTHLKTLRIIKECILRLLARREHSCHEIHQKLQGKEFSPSDINTVLGHLCEKNLQSDQRFTETYVFFRSRRGYGPIKILHELTQRGIEESVANTALKIADVDWSQLIQQVHHKRFGPSLTKNFEEKTQQKKFLQYRGFTLDQINTLFKGDD